MAGIIVEMLRHNCAISRKECPGVTVKISSGLYGILKPKMPALTDVFRCISSLESLRPFGKSLPAQSGNCEFRTAAAVECVIASCLCAGQETALDLLPARMPAVAD